MATDIKVRGYHLDLYQHVNNARYLEFLEEARWEYVEQHGLMQLFMGAGVGFVVANINISYLRPAFMNETVRIESSIDSLGNKSGVVRQQVWLLRNGETTDLIADARITFCLVDLKKQQTVPISGNVRDSLEKMIEEGL